jgi:hypothetical protein
MEEERKEDIRQSIEDKNFFASGTGIDNNEIEEDVKDTPSSTGAKKLRRSRKEKSKTVSPPKTAKEKSGI